MYSSLTHSYDFRQSPYWAEYMKRIGWHVARIDEVYLYIRKIPFFGSIIKIQHPYGNIPFKKIDTAAKTYNAIFVILEPTDYLYHESLFTKNGYYISIMRHAPSATRKIDIQKPLDAITTSFSENAKRNIKKAIKNDLKIKTIFGKDDKDNMYFEAFYKLQKNLTDMKKFYAPSYAESRKKYEALKNGSFFVFAYEPNDSGQARMTDRNNEPIAAVWYGYYNGVVTYLQTGITQQGYDVLANYLLVLEGIKVGKTLHCKVFDFESIYDPRYPHEAQKWKGYSEFKSRFHGKAVFYPPSWIKIYHPVFRWFYTLSTPFLP